MGNVFSLTVVLYCCLTASALAQATEPPGDSWYGRITFLEDSVQLGRPTPVAVAMFYPAHWQVVLPDSTAAYGPFTYHRRWYAPTQTASGISYDSAVYYLSTFSIEEVQRLSLPFWVVRTGDTLRYTLDQDSIRFWDVVVPYPDRLHLNATDRLNPLERELNRPLLLVGGIAILLVLGILSGVLARPLHRWWQRRQLRRRHERWWKQQQVLTRALVEEGEPEHCQAWMVGWKQYLEALEGQPYTKLTTRELARMPEVQPVTEALRRFDRAIYGRQADPTLESQAEHLQEFARQRYAQRRENIDKA